MNLDKALELALVSCLSVFPVRPGTKAPYTPNGFKDASREQGQIEAWWKEWPEALVGVPTGPNGIAVLDVDLKKGKNGFAKIADRGLTVPESFSYDTPSGGRHYVYALPRSEKFKQQTNYDGMEGVDRQTGASYVVWHGPVVWDAELTPAPSWLLSKGYQDVEAIGATAYSGEMDEWSARLQPTGVGDYATQSLLFDILGAPHIGNEEIKRFTYRLAILVQEGHPGTRAVFTQLLTRYRATSNETSEDQAAEFERLLRGAIGAAQAADAAGDLEHWAWSDWSPSQPSDALPVAESEELKVMTREDLRNIPKPQWIIPDLLKESSLALLAGSGGLGKTALGLYIAECVATRKTGTLFPSFPPDQTVEPGLVLYVGAEGIEDFDSRLSATENYHRFDVALAEKNMHFLEDGVNLSDAQSMDRLADLVKKNQYKLIVLDTFSQLAHVQNENDAAQIASVMRTAKRLRSLSPRSCVLFIHHATKDGAGYRGSSALRDNVDTLISAWGKSGGFSISTAAERNGKMRSGRPLTISGLEVIEYQGSTVVANTGAKTITPENETWQAVQKLLKDGKARSMTEISDETGILYATVKDHTKAVRGGNGMSEVRREGRTVYWTLTPPLGERAQ